MKIKGRIHFAHFIQGIPAIANPAISVPPVGKIIFPRPSANEKDNTTVWRVMALNLQAVP